MATAVLESLAVPRARHGDLERYSPRAASSRIPMAVGCWSSDVMLEFKGLRMANRPRRISSAGRRACGRVSRRVSVICEAQNTTLDVPDVTKETWRALVMESDKPVLVEFWAPWCGPCRMILLSVAKLSEAYRGKMNCFKLNTDESPDVATQYGIRSIPTIIFFKNGEKKDAVIGAVPETTLIACIEKYV